MVDIPEVTGVQNLIDWIDLLIRQLQYEVKEESASKEWIEEEIYKIHLITGAYLGKGTEASKEN